MELKQFDRYIVDFKSKWAARCAMLLGVSVFTRVVYFFGLTNIVQCSVWQLVVELILTMGLCIGFMVLFGAIRWNAPGLYALLGCGFCVLLITNAAATGNALRIVLAVLGYVLAGGALVATVAGFLPGKLFTSGMFLLPILIRVLVFDLGKLGVFAWVLELSWLLILAALFCYTCALKTYKPEITE